MERGMPAEVGREATLRSMQRAGGWAAGIGVVLVLAALVLPDEYTGDPRLMAWRGAGWAVYLRPIAMRTTWELMIVSGVFLLVGGLGLSRANDWARQVLAGVVAYCIFHFTALIVAADVESAQMGRWTQENYVWAAIWHIAFAATVWGLWRALRYFRSERFKLACKASAEQ